MKKQLAMISKLMILVGLLFPIFQPTMTAIAETNEDQLFSVRYDDKQVKVGETIEPIDDSVIQIKANGNFTLTVPISDHYELIRLSDQEMESLKKSKTTTSSSTTTTSSSEKSTKKEIQFTESADNYTFEFKKGQSAYFKILLYANEAKLAGTAQFAEADFPDTAVDVLHLKKAKSAADELNNSQEINDNQTIDSSKGVTEATPSENLPTTSAIPATLQEVQPLAAAITIDPNSPIMEQENLLLIQKDIAPATISDLKLNGASPGGANNRLSWGNVSGTATTPPSGTEFPSENNWTRYKNHFYYNGTEKYNYPEVSMIITNVTSSDTLEVTYDHVGSYNGRRMGVKLKFYDIHHSKYPYSNITNNDNKNFYINFCSNFYRGFTFYGADYLKYDITFTDSTTGAAMSMTDPYFLTFNSVDVKEGNDHIGGTLQSTYITTNSLLTYRPNGTSISFTGSTWRWSTDTYTKNINKTPGYEYADKIGAPTFTRSTVSYKVLGSTHKFRVITPPLGETPSAGSSWMAVSSAQLQASRKTPIKRVHDTATKKNIDTESVQPDQRIYYDVDQELGRLNETILHKYTQLSFDDNIPNYLSLEKAEIIHVKNDANKTEKVLDTYTVSTGLGSMTNGWFDITQQNGRPRIQYTFTKQALEEKLDYDYDHVILRIYVKVKDSSSFSAGVRTDIKNTGKVSVENKSMTTNEVSNYVILNKEVPPPVKSVTDSDETNVNMNLLYNRSEEYTYTIKHQVPSETSASYYTSYSIVDNLNSVLERVTTEEIEIRNSAGLKINDYFDLTNSTSSKLDIRAKADKLKLLSFYGTTYTITFKVKVKASANLTSIKESNVENYLGLPTIPNTAQVIVNGTTTNSNKVVTRIPSLSFFKIDEDNKPVPGVKFKITGPNGEIYQVVSDTNGEVVFPEILPKKGYNQGLYTIEEAATPAGYTKLPNSFTMNFVKNYNNANQTTSVQFVYSGLVDNNKGFFKTKSSSGGFTNITTDSHTQGSNNLSLAVVNKKPVTSNPAPKKTVSEKGTYSYRTNNELDILTAGQSNVTVDNVPVHYYSITQSTKTTTGVNLTTPSAVVFEDVVPDGLTVTGMNIFNTDGGELKHLTVASNPSVFEKHPDGTTTVKYALSSDEIDKIKLDGGDLVFIIQVCPNKQRETLTQNFFMKNQASVTWGTKTNKTNEVETQLTPLIIQKDAVPPKKTVTRGINYSARNRNELDILTTGQETVTVDDVNSHYYYVNQSTKDSKGDNATKPDKIVLEDTLPKGVQLSSVFIFNTKGETVTRIYSTNDAVTKNPDGTTTVKYTLSDSEMALIDFDGGDLSFQFYVKVDQTIRDTITEPFLMDNQAKVTLGEKEQTTNKVRTQLTPAPVEVPAPIKKVTQQQLFNNGVNTNYPEGPTLNELDYTVTGQEDVTINSVGTHYYHIFQNTLDEKNVALPKPTEIVFTDTLPKGVTFSKLEVRRTNGTIPNSILGFLSSFTEDYSSDACEFTLVKNANGTTDITLKLKSQVIDKLDWGQKIGEYTGYISFGIQVVKDETIYSSLTERLELPNKANVSLYGDGSGKDSNEVKTQMTPPVKDAVAPIKRVTENMLVSLPSSYEASREFNELDCSVTGQEEVTINNTTRHWYNIFQSTVNADGTPLEKPDELIFTDTLPKGVKFSRLRFSATDGYNPTILGDFPSSFTTDVDFELGSFRVVENAAGTTSLTLKLKKAVFDKVKWGEQTKYIGFQIQVEKDQTVQDSITERFELPNKANIQMYGVGSGKDTNTVITQMTPPVKEAVPPTKTVTTYSTYAYRARNELDILTDGQEKVTVNSVKSHYYYITQSTKDSNGDNATKPDKIIFEDTLPKGVILNRLQIMNTKGSYLSVVLANNSSVVTNNPDGTTTIRYQLPESDMNQIDFDGGDLVFRVQVNVDQTLLDTIAEPFYMDNEAKVTLGEKDQTTNKVRTQLTPTTADAPTPVKRVTQTKVINNGGTTNNYADGFDMNELDCSIAGQTDVTINSVATHYYNIFQSTVNDKKEALPTPSEITFTDTLPKGVVFNSLEVRGTDGKIPVISPTYYPLTGFTEDYSSSYCDFKIEKNADGTTSLSLKLKSQVIDRINWGKAADDYTGNICFQISVKKDEAFHASLTERFELLNKANVQLYGDGTGKDTNTVITQLTPLMKDAVPPTKTVTQSETYEKRADNELDILTDGQENVTVNDISLHSYFITQSTKDSKGENATKPTSIEFEDVLPKGVTFSKMEIYNTTGARINNLGASYIDECTVNADGTTTIRHKLSSANMDRITFDGGDVVFRIVVKVDQTLRDTITEPFYMDNQAKVTLGENAQETNKVRTQLTPNNFTLKLIKQDLDDPNLKLNGVKFELTHPDGTTTTHTTAGTELTLAKGEIDFGELEVGKYVLKELSTINGYQLIATSYNFEVKTDGTIVHDEDSGSWQYSLTTRAITLTANNKRKPSLPLTGGPGSPLFVRIALVILLVAILILGKSFKNYWHLSR